VKLCLKFRVCAPITLALVGVRSRNFSTRRATRQGCSSGHYFWEGPPPKIWEGKKLLKFSAISNNFRVWLRISPEQIHIPKIRKKLDQLQPLPVTPTLGEKKMVNFGPQAKKVIDMRVDPPKLNFSTDCISFLTGCWTLKFLHALEIDQGLLAHTPDGLTLGSAPYF